MLADGRLLDCYLYIFFFFFQFSEAGNFHKLSKFVALIMSMFSASLPRDRLLSLSERNEFVVISYPGIVRNMSKAIDTLGGQQAVNAVSFFA